MSERATLLRVRAAGRDLLLPLSELREVVAPTPVAPLPGRPAGIAGVVLHQGEFLPVLAWADLPGGGGAPADFAALAVLRPRLGLPLEQLVGPVEEAPEARSASSDTDPWAPLLAGTCRVGDQDLPVLDTDRLLALLHRLHADR